MTKKTLQKYLHLKRERLQLEEQLQRLEQSMTSPKAQNLDGMPRNPSKGGNPLEDMVAHHIELQELYNALLLEDVRLMTEIERAIDTLGPRERALLRYRYIDGMGWEDICDRMIYSWRQIHRIHAQALRKLEEAPGE